MKALHHQLPHPGWNGQRAKKKRKQRNKDGVVCGLWQVNRRPPPLPGAPPPARPKGQAHQPPPARRPIWRRALRDWKLHGRRVQALGVPSTGQESVVVSDDGAVTAGPCLVAEPQADAPVAARESSVSCESSDCTSTLSSTSTSGFSPTSFSPSSSTDDSVARPEAERDLLLPVPSESDD